MRIQFCGADRTVTGSCHLLEVAGKRVLLDCGFFQGQRELSRALNESLPDDSAKIDAVILSHGHLDHCGRLPVLVRAGFNGPIYCTPATADVARLVLLDSAKIQLEDAQYLNRRSTEHDQAKPVNPLYTPDDVITVLKLFKKVPYGQSTDLGGLSFAYADAGHILGSAYVTLEWSDGDANKRLLFTADIGRYGAPILIDPVPPVGPFDYVITESTYGNRQHGPIDQVAPQLLDAVKQVIARKGRLIVPSFAVGRTQTVLWYLQQFISKGDIPELPIFVDSPMGVEASRIYSAHREAYDDETRDAIGTKDLFGLSRVTFASTGEQSRQINSQRGPCVIIASSPTCEFGRVLHHLKISLENPNDLVVFVGFIPPETLGRRLQEGAKRVRIFDRWYEVNCPIKTIHGLSAHGDADELLRFLKPATSTKTTAFVVHGEVDSAEAFASRLMAAGFGQAIVPAPLSSLYTAPGIVRTTQVQQTDGD